jgi:ribosomal protein S1
VKIGQEVKVKLILLDLQHRKIWLSMKDLDGSHWEENNAIASKKKTDLADIAKKLEKEEKVKQEHKEESLENGKTTETKKKIEDN